MIYQHILLNMIVNYVTTKCYMQQLDLLFLTIHQHLTISCIVCYFWWYACLKCGFIHRAWRNLILFCYMCIRFYYLHRWLSVFLWLVHFLFDLYTWQCILSNNECGMNILSQRHMIILLIYLTILHMISKSMMIGQLPI
jgi:hypothetical protein